MASIFLIGVLCCVPGIAFAAVSMPVGQHHRGQSIELHGKPGKDALAGKQTNQLDMDTSKKKKAFNGPVISIELYYETKCPDCIEFLSQTLGPMWQDEDLRSALNLTMYPYGNAQMIPVSKISEGYKFWHPQATAAGFDNVAVCQHGSDECFGNLIQTCAISLVHQENYMNLIFCMASHPNYSIEKASYECMQKHQINATEIKNCVQSTKGNQLMTAVAQQTDSVPGRDWAPWVVIDGQHLQNSTKLVPTVCTKVSSFIAEVGGKTPTTCQPYAPAQDRQDPDFTVLNKVNSQKIKDFLNMVPKEV